MAAGQQPESEWANSRKQHEAEEAATALYVDLMADRELGVAYDHILALLPSDLAEKALREAHANREKTDA